MLNKVKNKFKAQGIEFVRALVWEGEVTIIGDEEFFYANNKYKEYLIVNADTLKERMYHSVLYIPFKYYASNNYYSIVIQ